MCLLLREAVLMQRASCYYGGLMDNKSFENWLEKASVIKGYAHFDERVALKSIISRISQPSYIEHHAFKPFIHYSQIFEKFSKQERKEKIRELYYSSHQDRCIYQYYSHILDELYIKRVQSDNISDVAIAYRTDLHKNNIHFAKQAFDFIKSQKQCIIMVGDFTNFFDNLQHQYLKYQLCNLLGCTTLPNDFYKVFRSITKFSYVNLVDILSYYKLEDTFANRRDLNSKDVIMPIQELRKNKNLIHTNVNAFGIPQGSAISAILSNIYMLDFDKSIHEYVKLQNGLYLRYSDDSIFIFPIENKTEFLTHYNFLMNSIKAIPNLELQKEKTKLYFYSNNSLENIDTLIGNESNGKNIIDYLGFSFNGKKVSIRDKTIGKFYYRAYHKADTIAKWKWFTPKGNFVTGEKLYKTYTIKGAHEKPGNFLTYVKRSTRCFGKEENVSHILNVHLGKIKKRAHRKI